MRLTSTSDKLQLVTSTAAAIHVFAAYDDSSCATPWPYQASQIASATTTDILAPPSDNNNRQLSFLSVRNVDASLSCTVTLQHYNGTATKLFSATLAAGDQLQYTPGAALSILDSTGSLKTATDNALASAQIWVGNSSNVAAARAPSGDWTIDNTGIATISAGAVTEAKQTLADNATADVSTSKHGYHPKLTNVATQFMDQTGSRRVLALADLAAFLKTAYITQAVTTTQNSLQNITDAGSLSLSFAIAASEIWYIDAMLHITSTAAAGTKIGVNGPASPTSLTLWQLGVNTGVTAFTSGVVSAFATAGPPFSVGVQGGVRMYGLIRNGANAGTIQLQFQSTTNGQTSTIGANSSLIAYRIG